MKKLLKNDFAISLTALVLIIASFVSMFAPVLVIGKPFGGGETVSFFEGIHYTKGLNPDAIPYCECIIALVVFLSLSIVVGGLLLATNLIKEEKLIKVFKKKKVLLISKFIVLIALVIFLFIGAFLAFFSYTEFINTMSGYPLYNWSSKEYGYGCILVGIFDCLALVVSAYATVIAKPSSEILYGE